MVLTFTGCVALPKCRLCAQDNKNGSSMVLTFTGQLLIPENVFFAQDKIGSSMVLIFTGRCSLKSIRLQKNGFSKA